MIFEIVSGTVAVWFGTAAVVSKLRRQGYTLFPDGGHAIIGKPFRPSLPEPEPDPLAWTPLDEMRQVELWRKVPSAFWLDPHFWPGAKRASPQRPTELVRQTELTLPCGCTGAVRTRAYPTGGWDMGRYAECATCGATWDYAPKYEDTGDPRKRVRGEVEWPNGNKLNDLPEPPAIQGSSLTRPEKGIM